jgi:hypothetical protein
MSIFNRRPAEDVETERARLMARADVRGHEMAVERTQKNAERQRRAQEKKRDRQEKAEIRKEKRVERAEFWASLAESMGKLGASLREKLTLVLPLLFVNGFAVVGQAGFAHDRLHWQLLAAAGFAGTLESIALYIGYHAHAALMAGDSATKLRLASYSVGAVIGGINYEHYAGPRGEPTAMAVIFGLLSLISPWLWAMHGRYKNRRRLEQLGLIDERAPHFSAAKWLHFPIQTWGALRYGIGHNIKDPAVAWDGYQQERAAKKARQRAARERKRLAKDKRPTVRLVVATTIARPVTGPKTRVRLFWTDGAATTLSATTRTRPSDHPDATTPRPVDATTTVTGHAAIETSGRDHTPSHPSASSDQADATTPDDRPDNQTRTAKKSTRRTGRNHVGATTKPQPSTEDNAQAVAVFLKSVEDGRPLSKRALAKQFGFSASWALKRIQEAGPRPVGGGRRSDDQVDATTPKDQHATSEVKTG